MTSAIPAHGDERIADARHHAQVAFHGHDVAAHRDGDEGKGGFLRLKAVARHVTHSLGLDDDLLNRAPASAGLKPMILAPLLAGLVPEGDGLQHHVRMEVIRLGRGELAAGAADGPNAFARAAFELRSFFKQIGPLLSAEPVQTARAKSSFDSKCW